jgi:hypothetical protein
VDFATIRQLFKAKLIFRKKELIILVDIFEIKVLLLNPLAAFNWLSEQVNSHGDVYHLLALFLKEGKYGCQQVD